MFPSTCSQLPCMNIEVNTLASTGTWCTWAYTGRPS